MIQHKLSLLLGTLLTIVGIATGDQLILGTDYTSQKGTQSSGTTVTWFENNDYMVYSVNFGSSGTTKGLFINYSKADDGGNIEIRLGANDINGQLIANMNPAKTNGWSQYLTAYVELLTDVSGIQDITIFGKVTSGISIMNLAWFELSDFSDRSETFTRIPASEYSNQYGVGFNNQGNLAHFDNNDYVTYANINFGLSGTTKGLLINYAKGNDNGNIEIRLGANDIDGQLIAKMNPAKTNGWSQYLTAYVELLTDVSGIQDITIFGKGASGVMNLAWFELSDFSDRNETFTRIPASEYSNQRGVAFTVPGQELKSFGNNDYVTYANINFGSSWGTNGLKFSYAKGNNGGSMEVRLGGPQGTIIGLWKNPPNTGSWWNYVEATIPITSGTSGIQDLTFVGRDSRHGILDMKWFEPSIRDLSSSEMIFAPLSCNTELDVSKCNTDITLSSILNDADTSKELLIPCGTCVLVDTTNGSTVSIPSGLNIEGMLYFPSSSNVVIETTHIFVQGKLKMDPPGVSSASSNSIRIRMVGTDEQYLHPHEENAASCGEQIGCKVGQKAFVVAGGQLDINGMHDSDCPSFTHLKDKPSATQIQIGATSTTTMATDCWGVGDEILITNTKGNVRGFYDQLVRTITAVDKDTGTLTFSEAINPPLVTTKMDPNTASEVASLSRKIIFEAEGDPSALHDGGHLMIFQTPNVIQHLEGVEIRNFGQQGTIGRYPIHFHMSNRVDGSIVRKNVIRQSNQRCVVIHGSHGVIIEENVAFDTFGHCYITEDGAETDNYFIGNLGARTKGIPNAPATLGTSDNSPSTYWITNPKNHYIGNVAAGSSFSGFWFELRGVRGLSKPFYFGGHPRRLPLYTFRNNTSHSNVDGIRTYAPGFNPPRPAVFENIKCYQNNFGLFIHGTSNLKVVNSLFTNGNGILYFGNGGGNVIKNSTFDLRCGQIGIFFSLERNPDQITIRNNSFSGYAEGCEDNPGVALLQGAIQPESNYAMATLENLTFDSNAVDAVAISGKFEDRIILYEDPDGSMNPSGEPGFFVNNNAPNKVFLDNPEGACAAGTTQKGLFCPNVCMRRVEIGTGCCYNKHEPPTKNDYTMVVTSISDPSKSFTFEKYVVQAGLWYHGNKFIFGLPSGNYRLDFIDVNDGSIKVPSSVSFEFGPEPTSCTDYVTEDSFTIGHE